MIPQKTIFHKRAFLFLVYAIVGLIPVFGRLLPILIGLMVLNWLIEGQFIRTFKLILKERPRFLMFSFSLLYFLYLLGLAYTSNFQYAWEDLETKFSLLLLPIIFATSDFPLFTKNETGNILRFFAAGCIAGSILLLGQAFYSSVFLHQPGSFYYSSLSRGFHPSYYAMYLAFASSNILCFLLIRQTVKGFPKIAGHIMVLLFFTLMTVLLSSKAGLLVWLFITGFYAFILFFLYKRRLTAVLFIAAALTTFTVLLQIFPNVASRVSTARHDLAVKDSTVDPEKSTGERMVIWKSAVEIIRENILLGVGTGDTKDALLLRYKENNLTKILGMRLNAHNQYLQTFVTLGIAGFLVLVIMLLAPAISALRKADSIYFIFLAIVGINILVESMFEVQAGVIFYAVFNAILFSSNQPDPTHHPLDIPLSQV